MVREAQMEEAPGGLKPIGEGWFVVNARAAQWDAGPYAAVRHPAYAGNLLMYAGVGMVLANWASLAVMLIVPLLGLLPRIRAEDALMIERLGDPYREYADRTPRLLPGIW